MSKENRRKPPENRGFFEKQPVFLKEGGSGSRAHGPQSSSDKTFYYINILFRADFPIKKTGASPKLPGRRRMRIVQAHMAGAAENRQRRLAMEYAREKHIRQQHIIGFPRAMFLAVIFFASSHSGLSILWEYHISINLFYQ